MNRFAPHFFTLDRPSTQEEIAALDLPASNEAFNEAWFSGDEEKKLTFVWHKCNLFSRRVQIFGQLTPVDDLTNDVFVKVIPFLCKVDANRNPSKVLNYWIKMVVKGVIHDRLDKRRVRNEFVKTLGYAMHNHDDALGSLADAPDTHKLMLATKAHKRPLPPQVRNNMRSSLAKRIEKIAERIRMIDDGSKKLTPRIVRLYAILDAVQEISRFYIGDYKRIDVPRVKFTNDRRIPKKRDLVTSGA